MTQVTGVLGVNITDTPSTNESGLKLGTQTIHTDMQEYIYVTALSAITQYQAVGIDENFSAQPLTKAMADDGWIIGFAQVAFAAGDYGHIAIRGSEILCKLNTNCAKDVSLYTSGTAGTLDDSSTSQTKIDGIVAVSSITTAAATTIIATYPRSATF